MNYVKVQGWSGERRRRRTCGPPVRVQSNMSTTTGQPDSLALFSAGPASSTLSRR
jgi:hypothetical protein